MRHRLSLRLAAAGLWLAAGAAAADPGLAGRWHGLAEVPGAPQPVVLDLAPQAAGRWAGSITLPGRGIKGAPLSALKVSGTGIQAGTGAAFPFPIEPAPGIALQRQSDGRLVGEWRQGGQRAPLVLRRTGEAQVDLPQAGTALDSALHGTWTGRYELGGAPRQVTLVLSQGPNGLGQGTLRIVGRRTSDLVVDHVEQGREFIVLEAKAVGFRIEGRYDAAAGRIDGGIQQGPFEAAVVLVRQAAGG